MTTSILLTIVSLGFAALTVRAMRRHQLREQIALLWVLVSVVMVVLSVTFPLHLLDHVAHAVGIKYGSDLLFFLGFLFMMVLVFSMSITISRLNTRTTRLTQELGLLNERLAAARFPPPGGDAGGSRYPPSHEHASASGHRPGADA